MKKYTSYCCLLLFLFCFVPAQALDYLVTESQIQELETICQSYKASSQKQQETLSQYRSRLETLKNTSASLTESLEKERTLTKSLNSSLSEYEGRVSQVTQENAVLIQDKNRLILTRSRLINAIIILGCIIALENMALIIGKKLKIL